LKIFTLFKIDFNLILLKKKLLKINEISGDNKNQNIHAHNKYLHKNSFICLHESVPYLIEKMLIQICCVLVKKFAAI